MTVSRRMIVVVEAVGAVGNGGGAPFSTNPQPSRRGRFAPQGGSAVERVMHVAGASGLSRSVIEKERATLDQEWRSGAERKKL